MISTFLEDENYRLLIIYIDKINGLSVDLQIPYVQVEEISYFIKNQEIRLITAENFQEAVQYGCVTGGHIQSLLRIMNGVFAPIFFENTTWPDSIRNDFSAQMHKFLASLTDTRWKLEGKTVLYVPSEGLHLDAAIAAKDKDLVQRLESRLKQELLLFPTISLQIIAYALSCYLFTLLWKRNAR